MKPQFITFNAALMLVGITACDHNAQGEGPMERSGKAVDKAAEKTGEAVKDGAEKVGEGVEKVGKKMQGTDSP